MILQCNPFEGYVIQTGIKSRLFSVDVNTDLGRRRKRISLHMVNGQHIGSKLPALIKGVTALEQIEDGDKILVSEGCTHHRQCDDIGSVKLPRWIRQYTGKEPEFVFSSGTEFPADLSPYKMIVHCGGCMLNEREMKYRLACAKDQNIPMTNYGILIAYIQGILKRSVEPFPAVSMMLTEEPS